MSNSSKSLGILIFVTTFTLGISGLLALTEREATLPTFLQEPPNRVDFLNEIGVSIPCQASALPGFTSPQIHWLGPDNKILQNIPAFRTVFPNGTLHLHSFPPAAYRQDLHTTTYRCIASSSAGTLRSRDVHIRAVVAQQWVARVKSEPAEPRMRDKMSPILIKCEIDLIGGGRNFIEVVGWKWDQHHLPVKPHSVSGERGGRYHVLPNGDLIVDRLQPEDTRAKIICYTRHKLTRQEIQSPPFFFTFTESPAEPPIPTLLERYPDPVVVHEGEPVILHCVGGYLSSSVRWEKFNGGAWLELVSFLLDKYVLKVGNSLVIVKSKRAHSGQYRCSYPKPNSSSGDANHVEYHVRVSGESFSVKVTINQDKSPLGASADIVCTTSSDLPVTITWYKDNSVINPGGRFRLLSNNVLQISQIQREDQGIYQCFGRKERESAQSAVRLQLADSPPRLLLGFLDQTLGGPGPDISLRCVFHSGYPLPKIVWTIDGFLPIPDPRIIVGDHVTSHGDIISYYNVSGTRVEDGGLYSCTATNSVASVRHSARLNIYGAPWVRVVPPVVAIGGEFLEIQCPVSGYPIAGISWEKDGLKLPLNQRQRVGSNGTLTITSVERSSDGGSYTCSAWDSQGRIARRDIQVNVVAPLRIAPFPEKGRVVEDERVTLVCSLSSGLGNLKWTKVRTIPSPAPGNAQKTFSEEESPFTVLDTDGFTSLLSIATVKPSHAGIYTCTASDAISTVSRSHELTVLVPVKIEPFAFQEGLKEGARSRLVCGVTQGDLPITFSFFKDDSPLEIPHGKMTFKLANISITSLDPWSQVLQFSYLTSLHTGQYTCLASNPASQTYYTAKLLVQVGPKWVREPLDANVSRGEEHQVDCYGEGVPPPVISWFKSTGDGLDMKWRPVETLWPSGNVQTLQNGSLIFLEAEEHHGGQYMCKIENGIGPGESKIVQLDVTVPPYFTKTLERQSVSQGKTHEVTCEVHGDSPMSVTWMKGPTVFDNSPANRIYSAVHQEGKKTRVTLVMKNLDPALDKGIYQCTANNSLGKVSQSFELWVEERPNPPDDLRATEIRSKEVVLAWQPPHGTPSAGESESYPASPVLTYLVEYSLGGDKNGFPIQRLDVLGERTQVKVENLFPSSSYNFRVSAVNSAGNGPPAEIVIRTLSSPPSAPPSNVRGRPTPNRGILISWTAVLGEMMHGLILGYRILVLSHLSNEEPRDLIVPTDGVSLDSTSLRSSNSFNESYISSYVSVKKSNEAKDDVSSCCQFQVLSLSPFTQYEIHISALNNAGEGPRSQPVLVRTLEDVPASPVRVPSCIRLSYQSLQLSWQPPIVPNGIVNSYKVVYYPITASSFRFAEIHQTSGLTTVLSGLQPCTNYSVHITPVNNAGESFEWTAMFCKTLEDVPSSPVDLVGYASSEKSVYLNWLPPRRTNGMLTHYTVYFRIVEGKSDSFESKRKVSPSAGHFLENQLDLTRHKYVFWMTASNSKGESPPSAQIVLSPPPMVEPRLVGQSRLIEIHHGQALSLHCGIIGIPASSSMLISAVRWTMNGGKPIPMSGNAFIKPGQNELIFVGVRKSDAGNYTCQPDEATHRLLNNGVVTYRVKVKGAPAVPHVEYRLESRNIVLSWTTFESRDQDDSPLGFTLSYRSLGSIQEWRRIDLLPTAKNYTLRNLPCGAILNLYMSAYNDAGNSGDSPQISVHVTHQIAPFPPPKQVLLVNSTSVRLNLYSLNSNSTYCPTTFFSISVRETQPADWIPGKEEQIPFRNEHTVGGLKEATSYEILITTFGYSSSNTAVFSFVTLNRYGEIPAVDVTTKNMVRDYSPFYANLTLIIPVIIAGLAVIAAFASVLAYCKTRRVVNHVSNLTNRNPRPLPQYEAPTESKGDFPYREQLYSTLPCPPFHPNTLGGNRADASMFPEMEDISPYATFQLSDPMKKFHEEGFSQEIVVPKFYDVMQQQTYNPHRDNRLDPSSALYQDRWVRRRKSGLGSEEEEDDEDDEDTESEEGLRYSALPLNPKLDAKSSLNGPRNLSQTQTAVRLQKSHPAHHTIHNHHLSFPSSEKAQGFLPTPANAPALSAGNTSDTTNYKNPQRSFPGLQMDPDSTSPETSPTLHHPLPKQTTSKKRTSSDSKKVSGTTLDRSKRSKEGGRVNSKSQQQELGKGRIELLPGTTTTEDVPGGNGGSRRKPTRHNTHRHDSDYSIAV